MTDKFDEKGDKIEECYYGIDGKPCMTRYGVHKMRAYNVTGDSVVVAFYETEDKSCLTGDGYFKFTKKYDSNGNEIKFEYFGVDDHPCQYKGY